jgi:hypothetical protein
LVFNKLQHGLFRLFREYDPILSKILTNLKYAIKKRPGLTLFKRFEEIFICYGEPEQADLHLPEMSFEKLELEFYSIFDHKKSLITNLEVFFNKLKNQENYSKICCLTDITMIFKKIILSQNISLNYITELEDISIKNDIHSIISYSIKEIRSSFALKYVQRNKISKECFDKYLCAIKDILIDVFRDGFSDD